MSMTSYTRNLTLPVTETRVLILQKQIDTPRTIHLRHLGKSGETTPATCKWVESLDASTWYDVAGTTVAVDAGEGTSWRLTSTSPYVALSGYGNVDIEVSISRSDPDGSLPERVSI